MEQRRVSFKVANALKEAGYPFEYDDCNIIDSCGCNHDKWKYWSKFINCTYFDAWIWLWREKKICINCNYDKYNMPPMWWCNNEDRINYNAPNFDDPEEAIINAIDYLVDNDLIK